MREFTIGDAFVAEQNRGLEAELARDYEVLGEQLGRRGIDIEAITGEVAAFAVAVPTWGVGTGGTRFGALSRARRAARTSSRSSRTARRSSSSCGATPTVSLHIPWDKVRRLGGARRAGASARPRLRRHQLQHLPGPAGPDAAATSSARSATPTPRCARRRSQHNLECIEIGRAARLEGADGLDRRRRELPRPAEPRPRLRALSREHGARSTRRCPTDWRVFLEHKIYEPAFYSTVMQDWGSSLHGRAASWGRRPSAWSTSATTRRT